VAAKLCLGVSWPPPTSVWLPTSVWVFPGRRRPLRRCLVTGGGGSATDQLSQTDPRDVLPHATADLCVGVFCVLPNLALYMSQPWHLGRVGIPQCHWHFIPRNPELNMGPAYAGVDSVDFR